MDNPTSCAEELKPQETSLKHPIDDCVQPGELVEYQTNYAKISGQVLVVGDCFTLVRDSNQRKLHFVNLSNTKNVMLLHYFFYFEFSIYCIFDLVKTICSTIFTPIHSLFTDWKSR